MYKNIICGIQPSRHTRVHSHLDVDHWFDIVDNTNECKWKYSYLGFRFLQHKSIYIIITLVYCHCVMIVTAASL